MTLAAPQYLAALAVLPFIALLHLCLRHRARTYAVRHPGAAVVASVAGAAPAWRRHLPAALMALAAAVLAVALARPQATFAVPRERASVMLVVDRSGSMLADDVAPTRLDATRNAATRFLDEAPKSLLVGFASYADAVDAMLEPTTERAGTRAAVAGLRAEGGTATGDALGAALDRLEAVRAQGGRTAPAAIVLLSDGATTTGSDPARAAARAKRLGIPVHTVALGTADGVVAGPQGEPIPVPPDRATLATIARDSGGQAFEVADAGALERVYRDLGSGIATRKEQREVTAAFAAGGLVLLLVGAGTALRGRPRIF